ncbi:SCO2524 family protein [Uniformispora flossi]|uniref:SCO2524 family protein n=1 Tax=Uniformispora flossi TaxID=3390723 RepID=UPI003C2DCC17
MTNLPRRRLLDIWKVLAARSARPGDEGPADAQDALYDTERLVCLLYPAMRMPALGFANPDTTGQDVLAALAPFGDHQAVPRVVTDICTAYFEAHTAADGRPLFTGGPLRTLDPATAPSSAQMGLETVESFSQAVTLCLSVMTFVREFERHVRSARTRERLDNLRRAASRRLTYAMTALRDSFVAATFPLGSDAARAVFATVFPGGEPDRRQVRALMDRLRPIRSGLHGLGARACGPPGLDDEDLLFSCGWTWGRARPADAPEPGRFADPVPSLYFTVAAMDGIVDLFSSRRTLLFGVLDDDQHALVQQLLARWELAQRFWSALARFGGTWPLQDIPWPGGDDRSDYPSLHVASIVIHNLMRQGGADEVPPDFELGTLVTVLSELAARGKITRRAGPDDPAVALHTPGVTTPLPGAELLGPPLGWAVTEFAPSLLKRTLQLAALTRVMEERDTLLALADRLTEHVWNRRLDTGPAAGLWDAPGRVYATSPPSPAGLSWHMTERVVEVLVVAGSGIAADLAPSPRLAAVAADMLREADHLLAQEMLTRSAHAPAVDVELQLVGAVLRRARNQADRRPAVAIALASEALRRLDALCAAREEASRGRV